MAPKQILTALTAVAICIWAVGCKKEETTLREQAKTAAGGMEAAMKQAADVAKETSEQVAKDVSAAAKEVAAPINAKAQELLSSAKKLINEGKVQDALAKLNQLSGEKLSTEQKALADSLKAQIDKLLGSASTAATNAASSVGGLLNK